MTHETPQTRRTATRRPSATTLAARQAVAETLRIATETPGPQKRHRALEHLSECGFTPCEESAAAVLCTFGQTEDPVANAWLQQIRTNVNRDEIDEFAGYFFAISPEMRSDHLDELASRAPTLPLKVRLAELRPGIDVGVDAPSDLASEAEVARRLFVAKPTERFRVVHKLAISKPRWARLRHIWRDGRPVLRATNGPPDWTTPTGLVTHVPKTERAPVQETKSGSFSGAWLAAIILFGFFRILAAVNHGSPSRSTTPPYKDQELQKQIQANIERVRKEQMQNLVRPVQPPGTNAEDLVKPADFRPDVWEKANPFGTPSSTLEMNRLFQDKVKERQPRVKAPTMELDPYGSGLLVPSNGLGPAAPTPGFGNSPGSSFDGDDF